MERANGRSATDALSVIAVAAMPMCLGHDFTWNANDALHA